MALGFEYAEVEEKKLILDINIPCKYFIILEKGVCKIKFEDTKEMEVKSGQGFGDISLLYQVNS